MNKEELLDLCNDLANSSLVLSKMSYVVNGRIVQINGAPEITQILKNILKASRELKTQWEQT
jgi:hypothetical protein